MNMDYPNTIFPREQLEDFCKRWRVTRLELFGSHARGDFKPDSDVDVLISYEDDAPWNLFHHMDMQEELEQMAGRRVDLVTRSAVEDSPNWIRRKMILDDAKPIYEVR